MEQLASQHLIDQPRQSGCLRLLKPAGYIKVSALGVGERRGA